MKNKIITLSLLSGVFLGFAFPPFPFPYLAFVGFVPLLFALEEKRGEKIFLMLYLTFFIYHGITNWWVSSWQPNADPFLMASGLVLDFVHPFFFMVPVYAYLSIRRNLGLNTALWLFPFLWTGFEWLHSIGDMSYPWLSIGYTQIYNIHWVQFADISGVWGVSFLLVLINTLVLRLIFIYIREKSTEPAMSIFKSRNVMNFIYIILAIIIIPYFYGFYKFKEFDNNKLLITHKTMKIGIVQPNINPWAKWQKSVAEQIQVHLGLQDSLVKKVPGIDMLLWSETAIPFYDFSMNSDHNFSFIKHWLNRNDVSVLTGFADIDIYKPTDNIPKTAKHFKNSKTRYDSFNAAVILNPNDINEPLIYHKMHLTPFSERLPFAESLTFAQGWIEWGVGISSWQKGASQFPLIYRKDGDSAKIGAIICIESIYPDFTRNYINQGAQAFVVITNDAWYNYTFGPEQHFVIAQMRAIESRRYIARCGNSGVSGFISPTGTRYDMLPKYKTLAGAGKIALLNNKPVYANIGDFLPYFSVTLAVLFMLYGFIAGRKPGKR